MRRSLRFIALLTGLKLKRMMAFRLDFFGAFFVDGTLFAFQLLMFGAIYTQVDTIGGFGRGEMLIFVGTFSLINALNMAIFFFGIYDIPRKITEGDLDHYLTKPISPLLRLTFEEPNPGSIPLIVLSVLITVYGARSLDAPVTGGAVALYTLLIPLMTLLWYDVSIVLRTLPFFASGVSGVTEIENALLPLNMKIPGTVYEGVFKLLFLLVLPYGLMATVPTQALAGLLTPTGLVYALTVVAGFTTFALWLWRLGVRHYSSASS